MHLIMDGHADNVALMTDREMMKEWLVATVKVAGMTPFLDPFVYGFPWPGSRDWTAITGFQPMMESGLSIHCWPEKKFVFIDLFSCNDFGYERVVGHISRSFDMEKPTIILLDRGIDGRTGEVLPARLKMKLR